MTFVTILASAISRDCDAPFNITKVIMFFCNSENRYQVEIEWGDDCSGWMFESQVQAKEFYDTMFDYMIGE